MAAESSGALFAVGAAAIAWFLLSRSGEDDGETPPPPPGSEGFRIDDLGDGPSMEIRGID